MPNQPQSSPNLPQQPTFPFQSQITTPPIPQNQTQQYQQYGQQQQPNYNQAMPSFSAQNNQGQQF